jgi:hypothetical protein
VARGLAKEVVVVRGGKSGVAVRGADEPELVGIDAQVLFQLEAVPEGGAGIFELEHLQRLGRAEIEVALVPALEVGKLVVGRKQRMGLAVALDLGNLVEPLPALAGLGVLAVDGLAGKRLDDGEHATVAQVAVVGDGEPCPPVFSS